ncbi:GNAT family N-acetyltransferase [Streptacidiphilus anmyonensis]|uniref:GNAT family N-acetyltransferase n=1 Tax=Streptacidiphilus anmyonensis TaxID=405782 RepID=UPI0005A93679|nr:GNAT family N-acetyltransferase [Streptacidiphilus anmyonensis]
MKRSHSQQPLSSVRARWRRDTVELSAVFAAVAVADLVANIVVHGHDGPVLLLASALALGATAVWHSWWTHRHTHAPPGTITSTSSRSAAAAATADHAETITAPTAATPPEEVALWRIRVTVADSPGSLASLCRALADIPVNIVSMQAHPLAEETVDEFVVRASPLLAPQELSRTLVAAGGSEVWVERADAHDLVDIPTRVLTMATRTAHDAAELPLALRQLFGRCRIRSLPGEQLDEDELDGAVMRLRDPAGGVVELTRLQPPFTPTEFARARALVELDAQLGPRVPEDRATLRVSGERAPHAMGEIAVRRAEPGDRAAATAMHDRCSARTLRQRYHGPVGDVDRYLAHLLDPRHGQTLAVESEDGAIVALAHLLWDDDAAEIAVLVEDAWQRHGIGGALVQRLTELARTAGVDTVYAVTTAANSGMIATLRRLEVPLDYQVEDGTLVVTAHLSATPALAAR